LVLEKFVAGTEGHLKDTCQGINWEYQILAQGKYNQMVEEVGKAFLA
jgi:hypothetical protein